MLILALLMILVPQILLYRIMIKKHTVSDPRILQSELIRG